MGWKTIRTQVYKSTLIAAKKTKEQKGVDEKRIKVMVGHTNDDLSYYQHGFGLKTLADEVVAKINYGLDFSHLLDKGKNDYLRM